MQNSTRRDRAQSTCSDQVNLVVNRDDGDDDEGECGDDVRKDCREDMENGNLITGLRALHPLSTTGTLHEIHPHDHGYVPVEKISNYTDVVFAICLTCLVFPLTTSTNEYDIGQDLKTILAQEFGNILVYAVSYIMMLSVWQQHCWVFAGFEQVGDTIVILNVVFLLCLTTVPYFASFIATHRNTPLSVQLLAFTLMVMGLVMCVIVGCAYRKRKMLIREFRQRRYRPSLVEYLVAFGLHAFSSALAVALSRKSVLASYIFLFFVVFAGTCAAFCMALYKYMFVSKPHRMLWRQFIDRLSARPLPKHRLTALTDGVFAVVGMLIIMNLIGEMAPHHKLDAAKSTRSLDSRLKVILYEEREILLAHGAAFVTTGMMWYIQTMLTNNVSRLNRYMRIAVQSMLISLGLTPYSFRLLIRYSKTAREANSLSANEDTTIMFHCGLLIVTSGTQFIYWIMAHWSKHKLLVHQNMGHHIKSLTILLVYPILNLTLFLLVLKPGAVTSMTVWRVQTGSILLFFTIKTVFEIYTYISRRSPPQKCEPQSVRDEALAKTNHQKTCTCDRVAMSKVKESIRDVTRTAGIAVVFEDNRNASPLGGRV
ncbi:endosomal/lysosomal proton channel TMEM175-like [Diadema setosum]|uniref:endosomal/lysosomal proton channel TMEM175-like n=1 Tax=Diadema setosum TaxID=31175 RepID=UPI003B39FC61